MGHDLTRMLLAGMPSDWTARERIVALVLADHCSDRTHSGYVSNAQLCEETGLGVQSVRRALASLALRGYELRVLVTIGSDGRAVYTNRGRATDYRIPILPPRSKAITSDHLPARKGNQSRPKGNQSRPERPAQIDCPNPSNPPTTKRGPPSVVTPTGGRQFAGVGGATRQPIEQAAWAAIQQRRMLCETTISTPTTSGTTTSRPSSGSAQRSATRASA